MADKTTTPTGTRTRAPATARKTGGGTAPAAKAARVTAQEEHGIPVLVPEVHVRHVTLPRVPGVDLNNLHVPMPAALRDRVPMPDKKHLVLLGGLAGMAAFGAISWPIAGVVAAATYVAERGAQDAARRELAEKKSDRTGRGTAKEG